MPADAGDAAPLFGIVVPVHDVADYLIACLDSIREQSQGDFEVVAVDDASTDDSPALLDKYAAADARFRVVHLRENVGLGAARNRGLVEVRGQYVVFVDSDDLLAPDALGALASRIEQTGRPDVVHFAFARSYADGRLEPDSRSTALAPEAVVTAEERPALLEIFPTAWNKAYRKDFLDAHGFRFGTGYYEDIPWTYPVLVTAGSIATLDRVCYLYRQRGTGSILSSSGRRHLDIFAQFDAAFGYLDAHPELERWRSRLFDRLSRHVPTVLDTAERIPADVRREFFAAASAAFRRHRPAGYLPAGGAAVKVRLIERNDYRAYRTAQLANRMARRIRPRREG
jgi:glycosyltransferase involved in cell wall biosynthesis